MPQRSLDRDPPGCHANVIFVPVVIVVARMTDEEEVQHFLVKDIGRKEKAQFSPAPSKSKIEVIIGINPGRW